MLKRIASVSLQAAFFWIVCMLGNAWQRLNWRVIVVRHTRNDLEYFLFDGLVLVTATACFILGAELWAGRLTGSWRNTVFAFYLAVICSLPFCLWHIYLD